MSQRPIAGTIAAMKYAIRRLSGDDRSRRYHLYDAEDQLVLVADHGTPWLSDEPFRHVRLALPNGEPVAVVDLPWPVENPRRPQAPVYAVIYEHAVYAIFSAHSGISRPFPYHIAEVEGHRWLVLPGADAVHHLYAGTPSGLAFSQDPRELNLPPEIGRITAVDDPIQVELTLPPDVVLREPALFALALAFLLDA